MAATRPYHAMKRSILRRYSVGRWPLRSGPSARELGAPGRQPPIPFPMERTFRNPALGEDGSGCDLDAVRRHLIEPVGQAILFPLQVVLALEAHPELCRVAKEAREQ